MQAAKDSFYMALCTRLQQVNPQRTVVIDGEVRPGLVVTENEPAVCTQPPEAYCMEWGTVKPFSESPLVSSSLLMAEVTIRYRTGGVNHGGGDRGRSLTRMDAELLAICTPTQAPKQDYTQSEPISLGSNVFWKLPILGAATQNARLLGRSATTTVFFYPESAA